MIKRLCTALTGAILILLLTAWYSGSADPAALLNPRRCVLADGSVDFNRIIARVEHIPPEYSIEQANADECAVFLHYPSGGDSKFLSGERHFQRFLTQAEQGLPAAVRIADFYTVETSIRLASITDLYFDGQQYFGVIQTKAFAVNAERDGIRKFAFPYLVSFTDSSGKNVFVATGNKDFTEKDFWAAILSNDLNTVFSMQLVTRTTP